MKLFKLLGLAALLLTPAAAQTRPVDFTVASATTEDVFKLSEAKGKYVALHFLLKTECPLCLRFTNDYFTKSAKLPNVVQVFLKPDSVEEIKKWAAKMPEAERARRPIYRDAEAKLAKAFKIPDGYKFHGEVVHYPALVLLDPDGKEVFRYIGKNNGDRFEFEKLEAKITELNKAKN
jgi:thioredoxin-dependent peroxiredoxin